MNTKDRAGDGCSQPRPSARDNLMAAKDGETRGCRRDVAEDAKHINMPAELAMRVDYRAIVGRRRRIRKILRPAMVVGSETVDQTVFIGC